MSRAACRSTGFCLLRRELPACDLSDRVHGWRTSGHLLLT
jgi:hypothetical protein